jgi:hypothetical protein
MFKILTGGLFRVIIPRPSLNSTSMCSYPMKSTPLFKKMAGGLLPIEPRLPYLLHFP